MRSSHASAELTSASASPRAWWARAISLAGRSLHAGRAAISANASIACRAVPMACAPWPIWKIGPIGSVARGPPVHGAANSNTNRSGTCTPSIE